MAIPPQLFVTDDPSAPCPPPAKIGRPPTSGAAASFYPLAVDPRDYALLYATARLLQLGRAKIVVTCDGNIGSAAPQPFKRHIAIPADQRHTIKFPGACNFSAFTNTGACRISGGEVHIGWNGGTPIIPPELGEPSVPTGNVYPPVMQSFLNFDPYTFGGDFALNVQDLEAAYVDGGNVYPFVWIWFIADGPGGSCFYFTSPDVPQADGYSLEPAEVGLDLFGWGEISLYRLQRTLGPQVSISTGEILELFIAERF